MDKLNFLNKMTMRLWAGRMSKNDSVTAKLGKSQEKDRMEEKGIKKRFELLRRYQADLKNVPDLRES